MRVFVCSYGQAYPTHVIHRCLCFHTWLVHSIVYAGNQGLIAGYQHHTEIHWSRSWSVQIPQPAISPGRSHTQCPLFSVKPWIRAPSRAGFTPCHPLTPWESEFESLSLHVSPTDPKLKEVTDLPLFLSFSVTFMDDRMWPKSYMFLWEHEKAQCVSEEMKRQ